MCEDRTMKKLAPLIVVILALLMQVRVAYACDATGLWPAEDCDRHGLVSDLHPGEPSDRGDRCDVSLELAVRGGRACTDLAGLLVEPSGVDIVALPVALPALAVIPVRKPPALLADGSVPAAAGNRIWLETARLRL